MKRNGVANLAAGNGLHLSTDTCAFCFHSLFPFLFVAILPFLLLRDDYYFPLCVFVSRASLTILPQQNKAGK